MITENNAILSERGACLRSRIMVSVNCVATFMTDLDPREETVDSQHVRPVLSVRAKY
jgi:hypothetical protein